jgi:chromosomal replication initiator protein
MITIAAIQHAVAEEWGVTVIDITSRRRGHRESIPRMAGYLLARDLTPHSLPVIAREFHKADHTTVWHGIAVAERRMAEQPDYAARVNAVRARLTHGEKPLHG